ncbi:AI-2E family transporter [Chloroflexi bacterium TSY]|nr:AI-2E family transporter [Chloroflexi bacterium TSY]
MQASIPSDEHVNVDSTDVHANEYETSSSDTSVVPIPSAVEPPQTVMSSTVTPQTVTVYAASEKWDPATKRTVLVILLIALLFALWLSRPVLPILVVSGIIAYLLKPIVDLAERIRIPRSLSTIVLFLLLAVGLIITPILVGPILIRQLSALNVYDPLEIANILVNWTENTFSNAPENWVLLGGRIEIPIGDLFRQFQTNFTEFQFNFIPTLTEILNYVQRLLGTATSVVGSTAAFGFGVVGSIFQVLFTTIVVFIVSLYLTKDAPAIRSYLEGLFPQSYQPEFIELLRRIGHIWQLFFRGQLILAITIGVITWLVLELIGMPGALILGIVAGVLEVIPNLGPTLAMFPAVIVALIQGSSNPAVAEFGNLGFALLTIGVYFLIQQIENGVIVPRVIGDSVNLHPVVVICGVIVGLSTVGILGAFLAAPVIATVRVVGSYIHAKLLDNPPFMGETIQQRREAHTQIYRRTVTGDELRARDQQQNQTPADQDTSSTSSGSSTSLDPQLMQSDHSVAPDAESQTLMA